MHCFKVSITFCIFIVSVFYVRVHCTSNLENSTNTSFFNNTSLLQDEKNLNVRDIWKQTEKAVKKFTSVLVKSILPIMVKGSEGMNISTKCTSSLLKTLAGVKQMKLWAMKMLDASGKVPNGILSGTLTSYGDYDLCLSVNVTKQFQGQYCLIDVSAPMPERRPFLPVDLTLPEFENFSKPDVLMREIVSRAQHYYYLVLRSSFCVPSTCSREDVQKIADKAMEETGINWPIRVSNCEIKKPTVLQPNEIVIICVLGFVAFIAFLGTLIDVILTLKSKDETFKSQTGTLVQCLLCFSAYTNTKRLLKKDTSPDTIKFFHGIKVISVLWVILNHTYLYNNIQNTSTLLKARDMGKDIAFSVVLNGFLAVETFFFITGCLVVYGRMKIKQNKINIFLYIFRRVWRLTPAFMFVIAFTFLIPHMGSGPVWKEIVGGMVDKCKANWWTNLLYFNNFIPSANMCLQWTWYIAVDVHLYILALAVLIPIKSRPRLGFAIIAIMFFTSIVAIAASTIYFQLYPTGLYVFPHPDDQNYFADNGYFRTHIHIPTYCIGMCVGYVLATRKKLKIPLVANIIGWLVAFTMALLILYGVYDWNQGNLPTLAVSTLYACTSKAVFALALAWVTIMCFTGNGGIANTILSWPAFVPFSRLTFMAYLVHPVIQHMVVGSCRVTVESNHRTAAVLFLSFSFAGFLAAYVFSLLFESPFMALEKIMFAKQIKQLVKKQQEGEEKEEKKTVFDYTSKKEKNGVYTINIRQINSNDQ